MKKKWLLVAGIVFLFVVLGNMGVPRQAAMACWVHFSSQELFQESDVILIGDIVGPVGEEYRKTQGLPESWVTYWKVKVYYYLKGNQQSNEFIIETPGAENKSMVTSIDYRLDQWGNTVFLFLRQRDGFYQPLSPQGVVNLKKNQYSQKTDEPLSGPLILKKFNIYDPKISQQEKSELERLILENTFLVIPKNVPRAQPFNSKEFFPVFLVLVAVGIGFARQRLKRKE